MLNIKTSDFSVLKNDIKNYIKSLDNYKEIVNELNPSTIDLLTSLIAGYAAYTNFKYTMNKEETFLNTAKLDTSVFQIALALGYRIQRAKAPIIELRYIGSEDIIIHPGDSLGKYILDNKEYDVIYFDYPKKLKTNDYFNAYIGIFQSKNVNTLLNDFNILNIEPSFLRSIDNDNVLIETKNGLQKPSIKFEDFILNKKMVNWSKTNTVLSLYINDKNNNFGEDVENLTLYYLETDGIMNEIKETQFKLNNNFIFSEVMFNGLNEDNIDKIKKMAPNLRNTKGRAVTLDDYYYYIMNTNLFEDIYVEPEQNTPANWKLEFIEFDDFQKENMEYSLNIEGSYISLLRYSYESLNDFKIRFYNLLQKNKLISPRLVKSEDNENYEIFLEQKFLEREITITGKNINPVKLNDFVRAQGCILNVYYVKKGNQVLRETLKTSELIFLDNYIKNFSIVGIKLVYIPAVPKVASLTLEVKLVDDRFEKEVYDYIKKIINNYQYKVNTSFEINNIITEISKYKTFLNGVEIYPVQYVKNLTSDDVINTQKNEYLVFYGIDISFVN